VVGLVQDTSSLSVILATTGPLTGAPHRPRAWSRSLHALARSDPFFEGTTISICRLDLYERIREILGSHGPHAHDLARERLLLPAIDPAGKWPTRLREGNRVLVCNGHRHVRRLADFMRALLPPSQSESILVLPLLSNGRVIGAFWIEGSDPAKHSTERMQLLETLGNCLSLALDAWVWRRDEEQRDSVLRETLESHEREKQRIALDVHDGAVQTLASAFHHLQAAAYGRRRDEEGHRNALTKASSLLRETMQELRGLMEALRPATLDRFGLTASIESEVEDLREGGWDAQLEAVPLQRLDGEAFVKIQAIAVCFTGMVANPAGQAGKGVGFEQQTIGIQISLLAHQENKSLNVIAHRALVRAGGDLEPLHRPVHRKSISQRGADMGAGLAAHALFGIQTGVGNDDLHGKLPFSRRDQPAALPPATRPVTAPRVIPDPLG